MRPLSLRVVIDPARARLWQRHAIETLRRLGHNVRLTIVARHQSLPAIVGALVLLETSVYRLKGRARDGHGLGQAWRGVAADESAGFQPDLILDLTTESSQAERARTLRVLYSGSLYEERLFLDLLGGQPPSLAIADSASHGQALTVHPAVEDPFRLSSSLDGLGAHLSELLVRAVMQASMTPALGGEAIPQTDAFGAWTLGTSIDALRSYAASAIARLSAQAPHWHVGWRRINGGGLRESLRIPVGGWTRMPDDGQRFYADPFLAHHQGRDWMFVEEFPFATRKGILSVVEVGATGLIGTPRPFLELPHHLSYPFVFEDDGAFYLIPESSAAHRVELYRATAFPADWTLQAVLIEGEDVGDATITKHHGRYYMFGTSSAPGRSSWDTLKIWSAGTLRGPWTVCGDGPALVDSRSARPAGHFFRRNGDLWRPAQDCSVGYGSALAFARVDRLDPDGYAQTVQAVVKPNTDWPGVGLHTLNVENGLEAVDGCTR